MSGMADQVVAEARRWIGTPYRHQAATRGAGADCLGLVRGIWQALGGEAVAVPAYGPDWRDLGAGTALEDGALRYLARVNGAAHPGDVVLLALLRHRPARHCGVMVEAGRFVHAQEHLGVVEVAFDENWQKRVAGVFRFPEAKPG
ncbi:putative phage cell wall peptidase, NlpC/P60 family [Pelagibacterium luteolum]|uniref:Putative phage cell wall peptidase, NlpC/P60 family n=2 Tax=Pelagibacterium luteolum TaxID=440168 RepID=A0A1G7TNV5_9HYPH|nr:putative phage cell wall peptidase, NlpC/P60 family [Pelagibacterium luteolum]